MISRAQIIDYLLTMSATVITAISLKVKMYAEDNDLFLSEFGLAFNLMLNMGNFGKLKSVVRDTTTDWTEFDGQLFRGKSS